MSACIPSSDNGAVQRKILEDSSGMQRKLKGQRFQAWFGYCAESRFVLCKILNDHAKSRNVGGQFVVDATFCVAFKRAIALGETSCNTLSDAKSCRRS